MLKTGNPNQDHFKLYYWHGATQCGRYKLPMLAPTQATPTPNVISFHERSRVTHPERYWMDFFVDDCRFERFWSYPEQSLPLLKRFAGVIATDYSMTTEMLPGQALWNCTRNRVMAYYLQQRGVNTIPVATWSSPDDLDWCFDGLPENSSIAISTNGCLSEPFSKEILLEGVKALYAQKRPTHLVVCGCHVPEFDGYGNVMYYQSFSQRMQSRLEVNA